MRKIKETGNHANDGETDLAQKARNGDAWAFQKIYERHTRPLYAFIAHHLEGSPQEVEDIWQETWIAAVHALQGFRGESRFFTWLCSIARHKIADHFRKPGRSESLLSLDGLENMRPQIDNEPIPEQILANRIVRLQVVEALMALRVDYRTVLMYRYVDEQRVTEIASRMRKNYKSTESLLARARKAFQTEFERRTTQEKKDE